MTAHYPLTPDSAVMPCCGADANEPGNVTVSGWAMIAERIDCCCGAAWRFVDGPVFDGLEPKRTLIERVAL